MTVIDCVVAPVDQRYDAPLLAVRTTSSPAQNVVSPDALIVATGGGFTVTSVEEEVALQPEALVTVTWKLPDALTTIDCVVAPLDQRYDAPLLAVSVTEPPSQNVVAPEALIVATGVGLTVTLVEEDVVLQPAAFVTVTL